MSDPPDISTTLSLGKKFLVLTGLEAGCNLRVGLNVVELRNIVLSGIKSWPSSL
jgi:hypothetical protein